MRSLRARRLLALVAFPLLVAALVVPVIVWRHEIARVFVSVRNLQDWIRGWGPGAPFVFMGVQALQVIVFALPGEIVQIAGGYLFGGWMGILLSVTGILVGSTAAFFVSRLLGRPFVAAVISPEKLEKMERMLASRSAQVIFFLLFLIPGIPKDILCYVAGVSPLSYPFFILVSTLGRLPGIIGSSVIGRAAAMRRWGLLAIVSTAALLLFGLGVLLRPRIQAWVERTGSRWKK
jgi:uncharacterized membrane protein YdjX (TVP38/TMEM64 family)